MSLDFVSVQDMYLVACSDSESSSARSPTARFVSFRSLSKRPEANQSKCQLLQVSMVYDMGPRNKNVGSVIPHLSYTGQFVNVCFDIGGVLLKPNLDVSHGTALHPIVFKRMMRSHTWHQYQEGKLTWTQTRQELALNLAPAISEADIQTFVDKARASLAPVDELVALIEPLRQSSNVKLYCMTNAAQQDLDAMLTAFPELFQKFDAIVYSGAVGIRKPSLAAFHHFLHETKCEASRTLFVDDTLPNVVAAEVLGFTTVLVEDPTSAVDLLVYHLRTEEERLAAAYDFLHRNKDQPAVTFEGVQVQVNYDQFLMAELLNDPSYLPVQEAPETGRFNFMPGVERRREFHETENARSHQNFPDDLDTTSLALSVMHAFGKVDMDTINRVLDTMVEFRNEDGLFQVYFDPLRRRMDHVINVVVCTLFLLADRVEPTRQAKDYIFRMLKSRAYLRGSLYYSCPETFLWHVARMKRAAATPLEPELVELLAKRVRERVGLPANAVALAQRVLACHECGIPCSRDRKQLARMQKADGSWGTCSYYSYSDHKIWFANDPTTAAFAVAALNSKQGSKKHTSFPL